MSRDQQPKRVRILSSGEAPVVGGRRRSDRAGIGVLGIDEPDAAKSRSAPRPTSSEAGARLSPLQIIGMFLCSSALGGACAIAFGLFEVPVR